MDDRREVHEVARARKLAPAIAVSVPEIYFSKRAILRGFYPMQ